MPNGSIRSKKKENAFLKPGIVPETIKTMITKPLYQDFQTGKHRIPGTWTASRLAMLWGSQHPARRAAGRSLLKTIVVHQY
jgi:hypothetical protein